MIMLLHPHILVLLVGRAAFSSDPVWRRAGAVAVVGWVLLSPHLCSLAGVPYEYYGFISTGSLILAGAYLFSWAFRSRDHAALRLASGALGLTVLVPVAFTIVVGILFLTAR
jgi:hypothetical protein